MDYKYELFRRTEVDRFEDIMNLQIYYCDHMPMVETDQPDDPEERREMMNLDLDWIYVELAEGSKSRNPDLICENLDILCRYSHYFRLVITPAYLEHRVTNALLECIDPDAGESLVSSVLGFLSFLFRAKYRFASEFPLPTLVPQLYSVLSHYPMPVLECLFEITTYSDAGNSCVLENLTAEVVTDLASAEDSSVRESFWYLIRSLCRAKDMHEECVDLIMSLIADTWELSSPEIRTEMIWILYKIRHFCGTSHWAANAEASSLENMLFSGFTVDNSQLAVAAVTCYIELIRYIEKPVLNIDFFLVLMKNEDAADFALVAIQRIVGARPEAAPDFLEIGLLETIMELQEEFAYTTRAKAAVVICDIVGECEPLAVYDRIARLAILDLLFDTVEGDFGAKSLIRQIVTTILRLAHIYAEKDDFEFFREQFENNDGFETMESLAGEDEEVAALVDELKTI